MDRKEIEARARGEELVREELARWEPLRAEVAELEARSGLARRLVAGLAGSRLAGLLAGYGATGRRSGGSRAERHGAELRRRRFRLSRRKRVLVGGVGEARTRPASGGQGQDMAPSPRRSLGDAGPLSFCIRIAGRDWESANRGGDAALARSLAGALARRGHPALVQIGAEADDPEAASLDVLVVLRGRSAGEPTPGRVNLLWQISHPEEASEAELEGYDRVLVASHRHAEQLRGTIQTPVEPLLQFTDPALFHPAPGAAPAHDVAFVGNWRGEFRRIVWDAIQSGHPPALYGRGWDLLAPEHAVAEHVPHDELHRLYSSCKVLLCDHWEAMRRDGFVSNKAFDMLACGAFVIADDNPGIAEVLPGAVPTYSSPADLGEKLDRYLADPEERRRIAERGRAMVLAEHTVERRAQQLLAIATNAAGDASAAAAAPREAGARSA